MQLRTVSNPERGCGTLKEGGFYARGDIGAHGTLAAWTWALGYHIIGAHNVFASIAARQMDIVNLPRTLIEGRPSKEAIEVLESEPLAKLPPLALIDHVGSEHYTPYSFYRECATHGPSRRIPPRIAKAIAQHTPMPIVFTHSWLPVADTKVVPDLLAWAGIKPETDATAYIGATWQREGWGIRSKDTYSGYDHWIIPVLHEMHESSGGKEKHLTKIMPPALAENTLLAEQVYGISWISRVVYIASEDDTDETLEDILNQGIEPVRIGEEEAHE
jgi:hypothetical protein